MQVTLFGMGLRAFEWAFINKPLRRYEPLKRDQGTPIERRPSASTVFLDAFDLIANLRGIGWSWSHNQFPRKNTLSPSIALIFTKTLLIMTAFDASGYIIQRACPAVDNPRGGSIFAQASPLCPTPLWLHSAAYAAASGRTRCSTPCITFSR